MAYLPTSVPSFSTHSDGDDILASHINALQDEVVQLGNLLVGSPFINMAEEGAIRDTDSGAAHTANATAWTNAIAALPSAGGVIYFPPGTYYVGAGGLSYTGTKALTIKGGGKNVVIIRKGSGLNGEVLTIGDGSTTSIGSIQIEGIRFTGTANTGLTGSGVKIYGATVIAMRNCHIAQMAENGIWITPGSRTTAYMSFVDCTVNLNKKHGLRIDSSGGGQVAAITFAGCSFNTNGQSGQAYHGAYLDTVSEIMFPGSNFSDNLGAGVYAKSTGYLKLTGSDIVGNYQGGLILESSFLCGIVGNNFHGNNTGTMSGSEAVILLNGNPNTGNSIIGNQINGAGGQAVDYGIREEDSATNNSIIGNTFYNHDTSTFTTKISAGNASSTTVIGANPGSEYPYGMVPAGVAAITDITSSGATITVGSSPITIYRFTLGSGDQTGAIITAGMYTGQRLLVINTDATNTLTFATASTSRVADGTSCVIAALTAREFVWESTSARWHRLG